MSENITLRPASLGDLPALVRFSQDSFWENYAWFNRAEWFGGYLDQAFSFAAWRGKLADPAFRTWVALSPPGDLIGYAVLRLASLQPQLSGRVAELERLYLSPAWQGQGLGRRLLHTAEAAARAHGCTALQLEVWPRNEAALAFYQHHGYHMLGITYFDVGPDRQLDF